MSSSSSSSIHPLYRLWHLYIGPFNATFGAILSTRRPHLFLSVLSPTANLSHYHPEVQVIFDNLAATYLLIAFNQAIVLRMADGNLRIWRGLLAGLLFSDLWHIRATWLALSQAGVLWEWGKWRSHEWVNVAMLVIPLVLRIAFLAGVGVSEGRKGKVLPATSGTQTRSKTKTG